MKKRKRESGLTLLEVVIASAILIILVYLIFSILIAGTDTYNEGNITSGLEQRGRTFISNFDSEFNYSRIRTIDDLHHMFIEFQIPVDHDGDGDVLDALGNVEYGIVSPLDAPDDGEQLGWYIRLTWEPDRVFSEPNAVAVPAFLGAIPVEDVEFSLNPDNDLDDYLVEGTVFKEVYDNTDTLRERTVYSRQVILAPRFDSNPPTLDGDVKGDGFPVAGEGEDTLFFVGDSNGDNVLSAQIAADGVGLMINVWHGAYSALQDGFHLRQNTKIIHFRNTQ